MRRGGRHEPGVPSERRDSRAQWPAARDRGGGLGARIHTYAERVAPSVRHAVAQLFEVNFILTSSVIVRRDALAETGGFDPRLSHAEDLDLWIRLARRWPATATRRALVRYQHREG